MSASSLAELREKHARGERESLRAARPDLPSGFVATLERALERDPARRWPDAGAFERALLEALVPRVVAAEPPARARGGRLVLLAAAALVVALGAVALWPRLAVRERPAPASPAPARPAPPVAGVAPAPEARQAPAPAGPALDVDAALWRARGGERALLENGGSVAPGDHLFLDYRGAEPLWVYVLDEDERGETFTLFPVGGTDLANPLPAGVAHRLPGRRDGAPFDWVVTSAGGREHVLVVASRRRIAVLEDLVAATAPAASDREVRYAAVTNDALATLRGIGGMAPAPAADAGASRLASLAATLAAKRDAGLWVRHVVLQAR